MATHEHTGSYPRFGALRQRLLTAETTEESQPKQPPPPLPSTKMFVLDNESTGRFADLLSETAAEYKPQSALENEICLAIAHSQWRLRRLWLIESALYDKSYAARHTELEAAIQPLDEAARTADAFDHLHTRGTSLEFLTRYEHRLYRTIDRLEDRLTRLRKRRDAEGR